MERPVMSGARSGRGAGAVFIALLIALPIRSQEPAAEEAAAEEIELPTAEDCATCHDSKDLVKKLADGSVRSLKVGVEELKGSIHEKLECVACHASIRELPHKKGEPIPPAQCASCHADAETKHRAGVHGPGGPQGDLQNVSCSSCHGSPHGMRGAKDAASPTHHRNIARTCGACHGDLKMVVEGMDPALRRPFFAYQESVHGKAVANGDRRAAVCTDCHGVHEVLSALDSRSPIMKFNIPATCGRCHGEVLAEYQESVHGAAAKRGMSLTPVCTDCHGIHTIKTPLDPDSSVAAQAIARTTCPQCHQGLALSRELGVARGRVESFLDSYHGLASRRGSAVVANCASCHGVHSTLPSSDPRSSVHVEKLPQTCGKCHLGAGESFTRGKIHEIRAESAGIGGAVIAWTERIYIALIVVVVGAMVLHNLLDLRRRSDPRHRALPEAHVRHPRLDRNQRIQHGLLAVSFILLVLTGFALKYPASWLSALFGEGETLRRLLHRGAAVVMMVLGGYHLLYLAMSRAGRKAFREMVPSKKDARDAAGTVAFNLGLRATRPELPHFGYAEKAEYWALIWGTVIMAVTGLVLWFKLFATETVGLPLWVLDLAGVVHYYEAWLATLAIVVWHFYFVIFSPSVYPMNWAWRNGWIRGAPPEEPPAVAEARPPDDHLHHEHASRPDPGR